jgi:hypothetical protein
MLRPFIPLTLARLLDYRSRARSGGLASLWLSVFLVPLGVCPAAAETGKPEEKPPSIRELGPVPDSLKRLSPAGEVWVDLKRKLVVVDGVVALRDGVLEMFACPKNTKEHEAVVAVNATAQLVHTGLLAVGAIPGHPVQFEPTYKAATGPEVEIWVLWIDAAGRQQKVRAQEWVKELKSGKPMSHPWVFAGSGFWKDETVGKEYYMGDAGDLICVSNFPSATLDVPIKSSQENSDLVFTAFVEHIPPSGTKVRLVLIPKVAAAKGPASDAGALKSAAPK